MSEPNGESVNAFPIVDTMMIILIVLLVTYTVKTSATVVEHTRTVEAGGATAPPLDGKSLVIDQHPGRVLVNGSRIDPGRLVEVVRANRRAGEQVLVHVHDGVGLDEHWALCLRLQSAGIHFLKDRIR